jgi:hypothetical protein
MNDDTLDSRRERLVAALYGELSPAEQRELNELLAADPALRAEYEELEEARGWLRDWEPADRPPAFALVAERPSRFPRRLAAAAWGFGGAAAAVALLLVLGLRVDRIDRGFAVRLGASPAAVGTAQVASNVRGTDVVPASADGSRPLTRDDLDAYTAEMAKVMVTVLQESQARDRAEMAGVLERFYDEVRFERKRDLDALRAEVHGVGLGLLAEQTRTNARLSRLLDGGVPDGIPAVTAPPNDGNAPLNPNEVKNHD